MDFISKFLGTWSQEFNEYSCLLKVVLCLIIGLIIGAGRAKNYQAAGLKTFVSVSIASAVAGIFDFYMVNVAGLTFSVVCPVIILATAVISSNTILFNSKNQFRGLTTSIGLICAESMALAVSHGFYFVGISGFVLYIIGSIVLPKIETVIKRRSASFEIYVELKSKGSLQKFIQTIRKLGLKVNGVELNPAYANSGLKVYSISLRIVDKELNKIKHKDIIESISALDAVNYIEEIL